MERLNRPHFRQQSFALDQKNPQISQHLDRSKEEAQLQPRCNEIWHLLESTQYARGEGLPRPRNGVHALGRTKLESDRTGRRRVGTYATLIETVEPSSFLEQRVRTTKFKCPSGGVRTSGSETQLPRKRKPKNLSSVA